MSNSKANTCQIVLGVTSFEYTREPVANNDTELYPKGQIAAINPIKIANKPVGAAAETWSYRFDKVVQIDVMLVNGDHLLFDLQEVTNQATWLPTLAGQQQAVSDINAWL